MEEPHPEAEKPKPRNIRKILRYLLLAGIFLVLAGAVFTYFAFEKYGENILRKYLQEKVILASDSIYHADFSELHLNILTGRITVDSFSLIPDTIRYAKLLERKETSRALYRITFDELLIDKLRFWQIWNERRINFRRMSLKKPTINIVAFPDSVKVKHQRWRVFYEDIYPTVSGLFSDFHIDSVNVSDGILVNSSAGSSRGTSGGEYRFSATLKDVAVNPFSYYNKDRVFYAREVDLTVHNFDYYLADSLYTLKAAEIGFSLTRSLLWGKGISMVPDLKRSIRTGNRSSDFYRFELPYFNLKGVDLYQVLTGKIVDLDSLSLKDLKVEVIHNERRLKKHRPITSAGDLTFSGLWPIISRELKFIRIGQVNLSDGSFRYYSALFDKNPELSIGNVDITLDRFLIDSLAHLDPERLFYARDIELSVENFSLAARDGIHHIQANSILFSTRRSLIDVDLCLIWPDRKNIPENAPQRRNLIDIKVSHLTFREIDLRKVFNRRILDFDRLTIEEPDIRYIRMQASRNPDPRFRKAEDFFESENEEVVYDLLKNYLWVVRGNTIAIENGYANFNTAERSADDPLICGNFTLEMYQFLIDSIHGMNKRGYFYSEDFDLTLHSLNMRSATPGNQFHAETITVKTIDSLIEARNLRITRQTKPGRQLAGKGNAALKAEFIVDQLIVTGLNHKKLFLDKLVKAEQIVLVKPEMKINSVRLPAATSSAITTDSAFRGAFISAFDVKRCMVRNGSFSYHSEDDRLAASFSTRAIDFSLDNGFLRLPADAPGTGEIRFDSLHLNILPLKAILADSTYLLEATSLSVGSYPLNINLKGLKISPLKSNRSHGANDLKLSLSIPETRITGFYFDKAIFHHLWSVDSIVVVSPDLSLDIHPEEGRREKRARFNPYYPFDLPVFMKSIDIGTILMADGDLSVNSGSGADKKHYAVKGYRLQADQFHRDTSDLEKPSGRLFNAANITLTVPGFAKPVRDSLYTLSFTAFGLSTRSGSGWLEGVSMKPNFSRGVMAEKIGHRATLLEFELPRILLHSLPLATIIETGRVILPMAEIQEFSLNAFQDNRIPPREGMTIPMPHQALREINLPLEIDTLMILNGSIRYEEQTGEEPGSLFFDRFETTITGLSFPISGQSPVNSSADAINVKGTARLMGQGRMGFDMVLWPAHPRDSFQLTARLNTMNLQSINPMLTRLIPVSIRTGMVDSLNIKSFHANRLSSNGVMELGYHNLNLQLLPLRPDLFHRVEREFLSEIANLVLPLANPNRTGNFRHGIIHYQRDSTRGFFNYIWKSALSGIKSTAGSETETQKQIRKRKSGNKSLSH